MVEETLTEDLDEEEENESAADGGSSKLRLIIILAALLVTIGGGAYYYFNMASADGEVAEADGEQEDADTLEASEVLETPYYFSLNPPFVVNFVGKGRAKFLQVNIDGLTRNPTVKESITTHLPHIRNNIVFLLSSKRYEDLISPEGKEELRKQVLKEVRGILKKETGNGDVEDIYFTSFVMQ